MISRIAIVGTGLIGSSIGLALKQIGFQGRVLGWDMSPREMEAALERGAFDEAVQHREDLLDVEADVYVLAMPVLPILDWMEQLGPALKSHQLVTDVGSTKRQIFQLARVLFNRAGRAVFLPGHPMAGKESCGAAGAEGNLFRGAKWLFTPVRPEPQPMEQAWRELVQGFGAEVHDMDPVRHDQLCAWVSHLPQMLSTALGALLEETFAEDPDGMATVQAIGGRALRETTRLASSPYSMWRDIALTNTENIAGTIHALEQQLQHLRENLRTPELREEFTAANRFRLPR